MSDELHLLTLAEASKLLKKRDVSPVELVNACLERIEKFDGILNSYIDVYSESALKQAKKAAREIANDRYKGPLHGIPLEIKDNVYFANKVTTMGSKIHKDFVSPKSAGVVEKLGSAGAIFLGKTNMHEYALGATTDNPHYGTCRNPWNLEKTPGGSSGGSAAAVAAHLAYGAIGSDTSGSIRVPAAACGIVGLKPTYGRVGKSGVFPEAWTLDTVGTLTRTAQDAALIFDAINGFDKRDNTSLIIKSARISHKIKGGVKDLVIGVEEEFYFAFIDHRVEKEIRDGILALQKLGAKIKPVKIPALKDAFWALTIIDTSETTTVHAPYMKDRAKDYGDDVRFLIECGYLPTAVDYLQALQIRRQIQLAVAKTFEEIDVLVAATLPMLTPGVTESTSIINGKTVDTIETCMHNVGPGNLLGLPSVSVPCGIIEGMPVGLEIIGSPLAEGKILKVAAAIQSLNLLENLKPVAYYR